MQVGQDIVLDLAKRSVFIGFVLAGSSSCGARGIGTIFDAVNSTFASSIGRILHLDIAVMGAFRVTCAPSALGWWSRRIKPLRPIAVARNDGNLVGIVEGQVGIDKHQDVGYGFGQ